MLTTVLLCIVNFVCPDHDECLNNVHGCDHQCHNTHGGYNCSCNSGYRLNGTTSCVG